MKYKDILTKQYLIHEYIINKKSTYQIAKERKYSNVVVWRYLKKYNIKIRNRSECQIGLHAGKNSGMFGKKRPDLVKRNKKMLGTSHPNFIDGRSTYQHFCIDCGKEIRWKSKRCLCCMNKGKRNGMFGRLSPHSKGSYYKKIYMRSSYEIAFAQFLDLSEINYLYEPKRFYFENCSYLPDFYIPEWELYIEIKGWWRDSAKKRFDLFKRIYPNENIKLLMKPELQQLGIL